MPDYTQPYWMQHPGQELAEDVSRGLAQRNQVQQQKFENARQTAQDKIAADEAARKLTAMQGYQADISDLQSKYPQGGPEFDRGTIIAGMKHFGAPPSVLGAGARSLYAPEDYAQQPPPAPITAPPSMASPQLSIPAAPIALPGGQGAAPVPPMPAAPPPAAPVVPPSMPPAPAGAAGTPAARIPISPRAIALDEKIKNDAAKLKLAQDAQAALATSRSNSVALGRDRLANTVSNQTANLDLKKDALANTKANQAALQAQRRANLAFMNKALAATIEGRKLTAVLDEAKAATDPNKVKALFDQANAMMDKMGVAEAPATDSPADSDSPPPAEAPSPMPKTKAELKKGTVYQTSRGPGIWNGEGFDLQ